MLSVVQYRHRAKDAKYSFVLFLKMGRLPLNQKRKKLHLKINMMLFMAIMSSLTQDGQISLKLSTGS